MFNSIGKICGHIYIDKMSSKFLSGTNLDFTDGTAELNVRSVIIQSLLPNLPVRTTVGRQLTSGLIQLSDLAFTPLTTPYPGTLSARDFITQFDTSPIDLNTYLSTNDTNISTINSEISTINSDITALQTATQHITADASNTNINCTNTNVTGTNFLWNGQQVATVGAPGAYLPLAGGTMAGDINMGTHNISNTDTLSFTGDVKVGSSITDTTSGNNVIIGNSASNSTPSGTPTVVCIGNLASVNGTGCVSIGKSATSGIGGLDFAVAVGTNASANGLYAISLGTSANADTNNTIAIGQAATSRAIQGISIGDSANCANTGIAQVSIGAASSSTGNNGVAIGKSAQSAGVASTSLGYLANAATDGTVALGVSSQAADTDAIAIGDTATASGPTSISIGPNSSSSSASGIAIGSRSSCTEATGMAIGVSSLCSGTSGGIAVGSAFVNSGTGANNIAIGNAATVDGPGVSDAIALGTSATNTISRSILLGDPGITNIRPNGSNCTLGINAAPFAGVIMAGSSTGLESTGRLSIGTNIATSIAIGQNSISTTLFGKVTTPLLPYATLYDNTGFTTHCPPGVGTLCISSVTQTGQISSNFIVNSPGVLEYIGGGTPIFTVDYDVTFSSPVQTDITFFNSLNNSTTFTGTQTQARTYVDAGHLNAAIQIHFSDIIAIPDHGIIRLAALCSANATILVDLMSIKVVEVPAQ